MYGMEYSQIIHPSGCIRQMKRLKRSLGNRISRSSHANRHFKNSTCDYVPPDDIKSDRLLEGFFRYAILCGNLGILRQRWWWYLSKIVASAMLSIWLTS
jgi:hypothetical protein